MYSKIRNMKVKRDKFNLQYTSKLSCKMGYLIPFMNKEVVPGDKFRVGTNALLRLLPTLAPQMSNVKIYIKYFFVPYRLIWSDWETFWTHNFNGSENMPVVPYITPGTTISNGTLNDYLGLPPTLPANEHINCLSHRAYNLIYNEFYRDEELTDPVAISTASGLDQTTNTSLLHTNWQKDLFTSARPSPTKGVEVTIPIGESAPVYGNGGAIVLTDGTNERSLTFGVPETSVGITSPTGTAFLSGRGAATGSDDSYNALGTTVSNSLSGKGSVFPIVEISQTDYRSTRLGFSSNPDSAALQADLSETTAISMTDLRKAGALQRYFEILTRGGSRYIEAIKSFFGVSNGDARLQRPEYLGGGTSRIITSEVLQNSEGTETSPQGNMAGHAFGDINALRNGFTKKFTEYGILMGLVSIVPETSYFQGLPKFFSKTTPYDWLNPIFQHLGEDGIKNKEVYASSANPENIFGYNRRYYEYADYQNEVHGDFRGSLDYWHMARKFSEEPALNSSFIEADPTTRIFAYEEGDTCLLDMYLDIKARRPLQKYPTYLLK